MHLIHAVIVEGRALDDALAAPPRDLDVGAMEPRDRGLARMIAGTALRRLGQIDAVIAEFIDRPLPKARGSLSAILQSAAAQLLFLGTPPHAAINVAVEQCRRDRKAGRFDKLANAVLRRVAERGPAILAGQDAAKLCIPDWLWTRWQRNYGEATARRIAEASLTEAALDLSVRADGEGWATRLGGALLSGGSIRLAADGRIEDLAGYGEGAWWVQDAAAALPARLLGDVRGLAVADVCAAPGGKTAQLASAGGIVTSIERSAGRIARFSANLARLKLPATIVEADAATWQPPAPFDAVLVDAPCTATGTIRRHPDILHLKRADDVAKLAHLQAPILANAAAHVRPGGRLVYCSCSLEPEEGEMQIARLLAARPDFARAPIAVGEAGLAAGQITAEGDVRTFPFDSPGGPEIDPGMDGFFIARLRRGL